MGVVSDTNWLGYAIVVGSTVVNIPVAGFMQSFGVFVQVFDRIFCKPEDCLLLLGWIAALPYATNLVCCLLVIRVQNKFGDRWPFILGFVTCALSLLATSYITDLWQIFATYCIIVLLCRRSTVPTVVAGLQATIATDLRQIFATYCIIYGLASSLVMYIPLAVIEYHFPVEHPHHVLCTSIVTLGAPIGILVMNPLAAYLDKIETAHWHDTFKIFSLMIVLAGIVPGFIMSRPKSAIRLAGYDEFTDDQEQPAETKSAFRRNMDAVGRAVYPTSVIWCSAVFLIAYAIFIPKTHFVNYMVSLGIDTERASLAVGYSGITEAIATFTVSVLGTLLSKKLLWFYIIGTVTLAISNVILIFAREYAELVLYSLVHGTMDGFLMTLTYPVLDKIAREPDHKPVLYGMTQLSIGLGQLVGLPLTGLMYDVTKSYTTTFVLCTGTFSSAGSMIMVMYLIIYFYRKRQKKLRLEGKEELLDEVEPVAQVDPPGGVEKMDDAKDVEAE